MITNDLPIDDPKHDKFGVDSFAKAIARGIENLSTPEGTVIALTGTWGSGKSTVANFVRHHLRAAIDNGELKITTFNPWWYSNEDQLLRAFFQHLYSGLGKSLSEKAKATLLSLSKKLLNSGTLVSTAVNCGVLRAGRSAGTRPIAGPARSRSRRTQNSEPA